MKNAPHAAHELGLALDQGGHASRACVFDARGDLAASALRAVGEVRRGDDVVEQDPGELVDTLRACIDEVVRTLGARASDLTAAALATQRSSIVAWDRVSGAALAPVISWQDRRAAAWLERFSAESKDIARRTGLRLSPHYGASKLAWCLEQVEAVKQARTRGTLALGPLSSFLAFRLLEERPTLVDPANASRTLLWNVETRDWDEHLCALFGVERELLPRCVDSRHAFGTLRCGARSVPLSVVLGDQSAALFAWGEPREDTLYANFGTGAFLQRPLRTPPPPIEGLLRSVVFTDERRRWSALEGTINGAGSALASFASSGTELEDELSTALATRAELPLFLNGISGLAAPWWRPNFRSRFIGDADASARLAAVAESITFLARAITDTMTAQLERPKSIRVSGGLTRNDAFCQRLADVLTLTVERAPDHEATARGAAYLALDSRAHYAPAATERFTPNPSSPARARYAPWLRAMQAALRDADVN